MGRVVDKFEKRTDEKTNWVADIQFGKLMYNKAAPTCLNYLHMLIYIQMDHELAACICIICIYIIITEPIIYRAKITPHAKFIETGGRCLTLCTLKLMPKHCTMGPCQTREITNFLFQVGWSCDLHLD